VNVSMNEQEQLFSVYLNSNNRVISNMRDIYVC